MIITKIHAGMRNRIGMATFAMMAFPIWINSPGENVSSERVSVNQVPQKTPVTSINRTRDKK
jgi:hypothetical protein